MTGPVAVLVGPPGAGKTTAGRLVAERLGVAFRDTDADVEAAAGATVAELFIEYGEPHFRALERDAVRRALVEHQGILALGGGAVLDPQTRAELAGHRVVFLDVGLAEAVPRVGLARDRPLLLGNPRAELGRLLAERRPVYLAVATLTVPSGGRSPEQVAAEVIAGLGR